MVRCLGHKELCSDLRKRHRCVSVIVVVVVAVAVAVAVAVVVVVVVVVVGVGFFMRIPDWDSFGFFDVAVFLKGLQAVLRNIWFLE